MNDGRPHTLVSLSLRRCLFRLNPCYAGRCSSTFDVIAWNIEDNNVSILVVLDDALVQIGEKVEPIGLAKSQSLLCWTML